LRTEMELYRIAQEALTNVRKHAHAHSVEISLRRRGAALTLSVRDDGRGFVRATRTSATDGGQGLIGMRERARLLGGQLRISSAPERGTAVIARIPIDSANSEKTDA